MSGYIVGNCRVNIMLYNKTSLYYVFYHIMVLYQNFVSHKSDSSVSAVLKRGNKNVVFIKPFLCGKVSDSYSISVRFWREISYCFSVRV